MRVNLTALRIAAAVEAGSLAVLMVNRLTVHLPALTSATGPVHGSAYLMVIALVLLAGGTPRSVRLVALVPGIGGYLALRRLYRHWDLADAGSTRNDPRPAPDEGLGGGGRPIG
ncbi:hypothetical protein NCC78_22800 [Micromonospora phytophila]|uniref:hypothetical protein n=1 Tax=Micromonospora phytophila TaxID=709888 RepID=UPI0020302AF6|nr:hypothetical protein [Micromonospora phytophila]MCM0677497.1 hypothetical protein [Micromonospora phytophila]